MRAGSSRTLPARVQGAATDDGCLAAFEEKQEFIRGTFHSFGVADDDVDDLTQELFMVLRGTWHQYDPGRGLRPYLFGIAFRIAAAHHRKRKREVPMGLIKRRGEVPAPDQVLQEKERRAVLAAILERIPSPRRAVLVRHELEEIAMADVAVELSIPLFTTYSRLRKARRELAAATRHVLRGLR